MRILLATRALAAPGGSETYVETVAPQLVQLGHEVTVHAPVLGAVGDRLRHRGLTVVDQVPTEVPDVVHVQHASTALRLRGHFPDAPMVYVCHSSVLDIEDPPVAADPQVVVTLSEVVARRVAASAVAEDVPVVRLRQPVEVPFVDPARRPLPGSPRRAVLSADRAGAALAEVEQACARAGIELTVLGTAGWRPEDPRPTIMEADVVFAVGRTLLEAMALGRACFMVDDRGTWGFVTEQNYDDAEAHAFVRLGHDPGSTVGDLLGAYHPTLGPVASRLARRHHSARLHARDLVEAYRRACVGAPTRRDGRARRGVYEAYAEAEERRYELGGRCREAEWRAADLAAELAEARAELHGRDAELTEVRQALAAARAEREALEATRLVRWSRPARAVYARARAARLGRPEG